MAHPPHHPSWAEQVEEEELAEGPQGFGAQFEPQRGGRVKAETRDGWHEGLEVRRESAPQRLNLQHGFFRDIVSRPGRCGWVGGCLCVRACVCWEGRCPGRPGWHGQAEPWLRTGGAGPCAAGAAGSMLRATSTYTSHHVPALPAAVPGLAWPGLAAQHHPHSRPPSRPAALPAPPLPCHRRRFSQVRNQEDRDRYEQAWQQAYAQGDEYQRKWGRAKVQRDGGDWGM